MRCIHQAVIAWFAAVEGDEETCRTAAHDAMDAAWAGDVGIAYSLADSALAILDLSAGCYDDAALRLEGMSSAPPGKGHPYAAMVAKPDLVEACVRGGNVEAAHAAAAVLERFAQPEAPSWALAPAARCRALLAETAVESEREFDQALELHAERTRPFDRARTRLLYGEYLRRGRRRSGRAWSCGPPERPRGSGIRRRSAI